MYIVIVHSTISIGQTHSDVYDADDGAQKLVQYLGMTRVFDRLIDVAVYQSPRGHPRSSLPSFVVLTPREATERDGWKKSMNRIASLPPSETSARSSASRSFSDEFNHNVAPPNNLAHLP